MAGARVGMFLRHLRKPARGVAADTPRDREFTKATPQPATVRKKPGPSRRLKEL
jgi:hypothetical protein